MRNRLSQLRSLFKRRTCRICGEGDCVCRPLNWFDEMPDVALGAVRAGSRAAVTVVRSVRALPMPQLPAWERGEIYSSI